MFKDLFSAQAAQYAQYRPTYPPSLFQFIAGLPAEQKRVWDCGTGNGQAALGLVPYFEEIIATDPSASQIEHAARNSKIRYEISTAESAPSIPANSVDLVTAAAAAHWFKFDLFYKEVNRVIKPGGIIALWTYGHDREIVHPKLDQIMKRFEDQVVGPFWAPEIDLVRKKYKTIPFPFEEVQCPEFKIEKRMNLSELIGYCSTWSAIQKYKESFKRNPLLELKFTLEKIWGDPNSTYEIIWPVYLRVGIVRK